MIKYINLKSTSVPCNILATSFLYFYFYALTLFECKECRVQTCYYCTSCLQTMPWSILSNLSGSLMLKEVQNPLSKLDSIKSLDLITTIDETILLMDILWCSLFWEWQVARNWIPSLHLWWCTSPHVSNTNTGQVHEERLYISTNQ